LNGLQFYRYYLKFLAHFKEERKKKNLEERNKLKNNNTNLKIILKGLIFAFNKSDVF